MGRKKQRVRWTSVEDAFFAQGNEEEGGGSAVMVVDESLPQAEMDYDDSSMTNGGGVGGHHSDTSSVSTQQRHYAPTQHYQQQQQQNSSYYRKSYYGPPRRYGPSWNNGPVAPRFERKAAAEGRGMYGAHDYNGYGEGDIEHLPNGFTKIRSKNLDVLFRKDYYAQSEHGDDETTTDDANDVSDDKEPQLVSVKEHSPSEEDEVEAEGHNGEHEEADKQTDESAESKEGEEESGEKTEEKKKSGINGHASPFYPSGYLSPSPPIYVSQQQNSRPNLYLYSPTSNTMIPCEEIVIPNPVVGPEGGTLYQGPSNIYLAFPCDNGGMSPGALGHHPGYPSYMGPSSMSAGPLVHYDQFGVPYTSYQQPATVSTSSVTSGSSPPSAEIEDHSSLTYTSETGTEPSSAESTTPHSPPDLSVFSPANWADANGYVHQNGYSSHHQQHHQWYPQQQQQQYYGPPHHKRHYYNSRQNNYHHYQHQQYHRGQSSSYVSDRAAACVPSSGGDSLAEEEEDVRQVNNEGKQEEESYENANQVVESSPKEQGQQPVQQQQQPQPHRVFIPGLPERLAAAAAAAAAANGKRVQKKRRKKKTTSAATSNATVQDNKKQNASAKSEHQLNEDNLSSSEEDLCQALEDQEQEEAEHIEEAEAVVVDEPLAVEEQIAVDESKDEEVAVVVVVAEEEEDKSEPVVAECIEAEFEEPTIKEVEPQQSIEVEDESAVILVEEEAVADVAQDLQTSDVATAAPSVAKPRRRRGKRSGQQNSEKQQRSAQLREENKERNILIESKTTFSTDSRLSCPTIKVENTDNIVNNKVKNVDDSKKVLEKKPTEDQWESVPADLKAATVVDQWETSTRTRRSRKGVRQQPQQRLVQTEETEEDFGEPEVVVVVVKREVTTLIETPVAAPLVEEVVESEVTEERDTERSSSAPETRSSSSAPSSRRSTLKKQNRKKRPSLDDGKSEKSSVSGSVRPVLIQDGLIDITAGGILSCRNVIKRPTDLLDEQALMIKDIGHGMREGPINMGRFGIGKYTPPDRSDEILSSIVARQIKDEEQNEKEEEETTTATADVAATASVINNSDNSHCQDLDLD